jgi:hypothetical protein
MKRVPLVGLIATAFIAAFVLTPSSEARVGNTRNYLLSLRCDAGGVTATFVIPNGTYLAQELGRPEQIWIDLSLFDNGFAPGTFVGFGPHTAEDVNRKIVDWQGLLSGRRHYYRLNALIDGAWRQMAPVAAFDTPNCFDINGLECDEANVTNTVYFESAPRGGAAPLSKWVDISLFDNNFGAGTFLGTRVEGNYVIWQGMKPAAVHYYRMNWEYSQGWATQSRGSILTLDCSDMPRR